ncbi:hypothetical protein B9T39_07385 [Alloscardovia macacae]|uniref:Gram-positive cocci surface proteins LPxTG domain-containing protein n=1 Tax=Alloscardovia macacae TaxID=1160091 RepID=A0A1Y2SWM3_9BIFI|nr:hypothetical protein B9T39_07385 [Alloscardovia macacae]
MDGTSGDDSATGADQSTALKTMAKALEVQKAHAEIKTIHITGSFTSWTKVEVSQGVTLRVEGAVSVAGTGEGISLASGAVLVAGENTLTMTGFSTALTVKDGAEVHDGHYVFENNGTGLNLQGKLNGSSRSALTVNITKSTAGGISWSKESRFINATVEAAGRDGGDSQLGIGPTMVDASLTTRNIWYYINPGLGIHLDHSDFYVYKSSGASASRNVFAMLGDSDLKNGSTLTGDGSRVTLSAKLTVDDSKVIVKNSSMGGLNINYAGASAVFTNSTLETTNISWLPSYGTAQSNGPASITFTGSSVVNTDAKDTTSDNGGAYRANQGSYVVTGGSYLVKYDPTFNHDVTTPTNGEENGNEWLSYLTLADSSVTVLHPVNKNGQPYEYQVENASSDGKKHVFVPSARVSFKLNNGNASFADGSKATKTEQTIRGYNLGMVEGNAEVGAPVDSTGVKFLGWYYKDVQGAEQPFDFAATTFTADTDVYAKWDAKTIVYHNGSGVDYIQSVVASETSASVLSYEDVAKAVEGFTPAGKTFSKWTKGSSASSDELKPGDTLTFGQKETQLDVYAQFTDNVYRVAFSARGGTFDKTSVFKTHPDVFTIETDPLYGGEVAVVKAGAKYNQKLSEVLGAFARGQITPSAAAAHRPGYVLGDSTNWFTNPNGNGLGLRFDDYSIWIFPVKGEDPSFTADATYYLSWQDDPKVPTVEGDIAIPSDLTGNSEIGQKDSTQPVKVDVTGSNALSISLTGQLDALKKQMLAISEKYADVAEDTIALSDLQTQLTYAYTLPEHVQAPTEVNAQSVKIGAEGMGKLFEVKDAKAEGKTITVTLGLKNSYSTYAELKKALTDTASEETVLGPVRSAFTRLLRSDDAAAADGTSTDSLSVTIPDASVDKDGVQNGDELSIASTVSGTFSAIADDGTTTTRFRSSVAGVQTDAGRDPRAAADAVALTVLVKKPYEGTLGADMLAAVESGVQDTTASAPLNVTQGARVSVTGTIDTTSIKQQMSAIEQQFGNPADLSSIALSEMSSTFTAKITLPDGMELPADLKAEDIQLSGFADTFAVNPESGVQLSEDKRTATITLKLKDGIANYAQLKDAVNAVADTMKLTIPGILIQDSVEDGKLLTVTGTIQGTFDAVATSSNGTGTEKDFSFLWTGRQTEAGKDSVAANLETIQVTFATPLPLDLKLPADMLSVNDAADKTALNTEHDAVYPVFAGKTLDMVGAVNVQSIRDQMSEIEHQFGDPDGSTISVNIKGFKFTAEFTVPEGMELPAATSLTPEALNSATQYFGSGFVVTDVSVGGADAEAGTDAEAGANARTVTVTFGLKDASAIHTYADLRAVVNAAGAGEGARAGWMYVTIPGVRVPEGTAAGTQLTMHGTVQGTFRALATSQSGTTKAYSFRWTGEQNAEGKDAAAGAEDNSIRFTAVVPSVLSGSLPADMLSGTNTEHDAYYPAYANELFDLTGAVDTTRIKQQMAAIEEQFGNPSDLAGIALSELSSTFRAAITLPEGLSFTQTTSAELASALKLDGFADTFSVTKAVLSEDGRRVGVTLGLKSGISNYAQLKAAVDALGDMMRITVPGVKVSADVKPGDTLTASGTIDGDFASIATSASGETRKAFVFHWTGEQTAEGRDFGITDDANKTISFTVLVPRTAPQTLAGDLVTGTDSTEKASARLARTGVAVMAMAGVAGAVALAGMALAVKGRRSVTR